MKRGVRPDFCQRVQCFACDPVRWECKALVSTDFGERECPFFKGKAEYSRQCQACEDRNRRRGIQVPAAAV